jgi:hypothetical protein
MIKKKKKKKEYISYNACLKIATQKVKYVF